MYLIGQLLQELPDVSLHIADFKNSNEFETLKGYKYYSYGEKAYDGIMSYYKSFCEARENNQLNGRRKILLIEEFPSLISYLSNIDKQQKTKKADEVLSAVTEILMLGRGMNTPHGVWIVSQSAEASLFKNSNIRSNFMVTVIMGHLQPTMKSMLLGGEDVPNVIPRIGEGILISDGNKPMLVKYPPLNQITWIKHIKDTLMQNMD